MMQVFINGSSYELPAACTLADCLALIPIEATACATAVNGVFVARDARHQKVLQEQDHVMTFEPITGG